VVTKGRARPRNPRRRYAHWLGLGLAGLAAAGVLTLLDARSSTGEPEPDRVQPVPEVLAFREQVDAGEFFKGNIHAHSARSDGDSSAEAVIGWYKNHGYQFMALTDHNRVLLPDSYRHLEDDGFVLIAGEEVTMAAVGKPIHVNALCTHTTIGQRNFDNRSHALQWAVDAITAQRGVAMINHPNFLWSLDAKLMAPVSGAVLLEVYNGHPHVHSEGDERHASVEALWQQLLDDGSDLAPAAVDDAHQFGKAKVDNIPQSLPGTGWVSVYASELSRSALCDALGKGRLYASNGPELAQLSVQGDQISIGIDEPDAEVQFFGFGGELLSTEIPMPDDSEPMRMVSRYQLRGDEAMVRAVVTTRRGQLWTKAYRTTLARDDEASPAQ
jgi:hypothetical protein